MNDKFKKVIMIDGACGFIGNEVARHFVNKYPEYLIVNFDCLSYCGNLENLIDIQDKENYVFYKGDIRNTKDIEYCFEKYGVTDIIHLAAESHVDRSILDPSAFIQTNIVGTYNLLNVAIHHWEEDLENHRFHHVSTDEVFGQLDLEHLDLKFTEETKYDPSSPYSASKASSDLLVKAYHKTYGMNITISNTSNNFGPRQYPEKLIPITILNIKNGNPIKIYGDGKNVRDWLHVSKHAEAIDMIFHNGRNGETYNVGGNNELSNLEIINTIIDIYCLLKGEDANKIKSTITFIEDRKGHDRRYAINSSKIEKELGWKNEYKFDDAIRDTIQWYLNNEEWLNHLYDKSYQ